MPRKTGPPRIKFDKGKLNTFAQIQCTDRELAAVLNVSLITVRRRMKDDKTFREAVESGRAGGMRSLRRVMWQSALSGNTTMQIWLSKQHLEMKEPARQVEVTGADGGPVSVSWSEIAKRAAGRA